MRESTFSISLLIGFVLFAIMAFGIVIHSDKDLIADGLHVNNLDITYCFGKSFWAGKNVRVYEVKGEYYVVTGYLWGKHASKIIY